MMLLLYIHDMMSKITRCVSTNKQAVGRQEGGHWLVDRATVRSMEMKKWKKTTREADKGGAPPLVAPVRLPVVMYRNHEPGDWAVVIVMDGKGARGGRLHLPPNTPPPQQLTKALGKLEKAK